MKNISRFVVLSLLANILPFVVQAAAPSDLVKQVNSSSVYYVGSDNKRYVFPGEAVFSSWYPADAAASVLSSADLLAMELGGNVTMRAGTKLIQIVTNDTPWRVADAKVYAVSPGGIKHHITSAAAAVALYGANWESKIAPVTEAIASNYTAGADLDGTKYPEGALIKQGSDVFYINVDGLGRKVTAYGLSANRLSSANTVSGSLTVVDAGNDLNALDVTIAQISGQILISTPPVVEKQADLTVQSVAFGADGYRLGKNVSLTTVVKNIGTLDAHDISYKINVYNKDGGKRAIASGVLSALSAGVSTEFSDSSYRFLTIDVGSGDKVKMEVELNGDRTIVEQNIDNNALAATFNYLKPNDEYFRIQSIVVDNQLSSEVPDQNNYGSSLIRVGHDSGGTSRFIGKYDLTDVNLYVDPYKITRVEAQIKKGSGANDLDNNYEAREVLGAWSSTEVNWNNQPAFSSEAMQLTESSADYLHFDITGMTQRWLIGSTVNNGFILKKTNEDTVSFGDFISRDKRDSGTATSTITIYYGYYDNY